MAESEGDRVSMWLELACTHSTAGRPDAALAALRSGLSEGHWWSPAMLDEESDLDAVRGLGGFAEIRRECERRFLDKRAAARPECILLAPATATWSPRTLFAIHRYHDTARAFMTPWLPLVDEGWALVVPQSTLPVDSEHFCWDDGDLALAELRQHVEDCQRKRGIDPDGLVIAGASQGAPLAMEIARESGLPWLCVIPWFPAGYDVPFLGAPRTAAPGAFLLGESDTANVRAKPVIEALQAAGVTIHVSVMKGVGHDLPPDFARHAASALAAL